MFQKKTLIAGFIVVVLGLAFGTFFIRSNHKQDTKKVKASSEIATITTQIQWNEGAKTNISTSGGSLALDNLVASTINLLDIFNADNNSVTVSASNATKGNVIDGINGTEWFSQTDGGMGYWKINLGQSYDISKVRWKQASSGSCGSLLDLSSDDSTYTNHGSFVDGLGGSFQDIALAPAVSAQYLRLTCTNSLDVQIRVDEVQVLSNASGVHTSTPAQIDGSEGATKNFIQWETFTPQFALESNTSVKFRFRTSPDHATWTAWSGYQTPASGGALDISSIADSASGANKYLQVESTLENTDGVHTPSVDSYSVQYHTDVKPNKPTAQTAVVQ